MPWDIDSGKPPFDFNFNGLQALCKQWDHSHASLVERQRYRLISNILRRGNQNNAAGDTYTHWRARNADWWAEEKKSMSEDINPEEYRNSPDCDPEQLGSLSDTEALFQLTRMSALGAKDIRFEVGEIKKRFWSLVPNVYAHQGLDNSKFSDSGGLNRAISANVFYVKDLNSDDSSRCIGDIANAIQHMIADSDERASHGTRQDPAAVGSQCDTSVASEDNLMTLTEEQRYIVQYLVQNVGHSEACNRKQTMSMLHGAAGTGKSVVIRAVVKELESRGVSVVVTCPTGIGASHLPHGRTFHSAFKVGRQRRKHLPPNKLELLRLLFDEHVGMVIIDEVSMLDMELLVLMDCRLRALYDPTKPFGGISVLLVSIGRVLWMVYTAHLTSIHCRLATSSSLTQYKVFLCAKCYIQMMIQRTVCELENCFSDFEYSS